jgi:glc operon protein GlcG
MGNYARDKVGWAHTSKTDTVPPDVKEHINTIYARVGLEKRSL